MASTLVNPHAALAYVRCYADGLLTVHLEHCVPYGAQVVQRLTYREALAVARDNPHEISHGCTRDYLPITLLAQQPAPVSLDHPAITAALEGLRDAIDTRDTGRLHHRPADRAVAAARSALAAAITQANPRASEPACLAAAGQPLTAGRRMRGNARDRSIRAPRTTNT